MEQIFLQLSLAIIAATTIAIFLKYIKQPTIISYILAGLILGPSVLNIFTTSPEFEVFSEIGVAFLLFIVGLNLNLNTLKEVGFASFLTAFFQVVVTAVIGFLASFYFFHFSAIASAYVGIAVAFSSTIIIVKLLSDKRDIETLYGKLSVGFLIVQDIIAIFLIMLLSASKTEASISTLLINTFAKLAGIIIILYIVSQYVFPKLISFVAESQELLFLFSISWALALSTAMALSGFTIEIGALFAGIALASSSYHYEISGRIRPLRDFFIALFFITLGTKFVLTSFYQVIIPALILSVLVLAIKPLIVMAIMGLIGYKKRTSFMMGTAVGQVSEFSLILVILGVNLGHLTDEPVTVITITALITIAISTYLIKYNTNLYGIFGKYFNFLEKKFASKEDKYKFHDKDTNYDIVLFGHNRIGYSLVNTFKKMKKKFLIIDYNPDIIRMLAREGINSIYADASDPEIFEEINVHKVSMAISTIPDMDTSMMIMQKVRRENPKCLLIMTTHQIDDGIKLYERGADYVIMPHFLGGEHASAMIEKYGTDVNKFVKERINHLYELKKRKEAGHEHPSRDFHGK